MSLIKRRKKTFAPAAPWARGDPLSSLHREMDELFGAFLGRMEQPLPMWFEGEFPTINVSETEKTVRITADLPGMDANDVRVTLEGDTLVIAGEKVDEKEEADDERQWFRRERTSGKFRRVISLPSDVEFDQVDASFEKGVLHVEMPRLLDEKARPRTVPIKTKD